MIYEIRFGVHSESVYEEIEANTEEEAKEKTEKRMEEWLKSFKIRTYEPTVKLSNKNFLFTRGAIYLLRYYKKQMPAVCIDSIKYYGDKYTHSFKYLTPPTRKNRSSWYEPYVNLTGQHPARVLKKLCNDGVINKPECNTCVAKFHCFTRKGTV